MGNEELTTSSEAQDDKWRSLEGVSFAGEKARVGEKPSPIAPYVDLRPNNDSNFRTRVVPTEAFGDIYSGRALRSDEEYVAKVKRSFSDSGEFSGSGKVGEKQENDELDKFFEEALFYGIDRGGWLGEWTLNEEKTDVSSFDIDARRAADYDDYNRRIDVFSTIYLGESLEDEQLGPFSKKLILGFDATISSDPKKIYDKLLRHYNDKVARPFGFSSIKYYCDDEEHGAANLVPHYIVGIGEMDARKIREFMRQKDNIGKVEKFGQTKDGLLTRFKILSEIRAENELYSAMLPDDLDELPVARRADAIISATDKILNRARVICARRMVLAGVLGETEELRKEKRRQNQNSFFTPDITTDDLLSYWSPKKIEDFLIEENLRKERGWYKEYPTPEDSRDTFVQIMSACHSLYKLAIGPKDELGEFRKVKQHNIEPEKMLDKLPVKIALKL